MRRPAQPVKGFGDNGVVDLKQDDDQEIDLVTGEIGLHATPVVAGTWSSSARRIVSGGVPQEPRKT